MSNSNEKLSVFTGKRKTPWDSPRGIRSLIDSWRNDGAFWRNVVLHQLLPATAAQYMPFPEGLDSRLKIALEKRGIHRLYSHQYRSFELAINGQDLVVATPTASGKSLCYNLPVLNALAQDTKAKAIYLFPTKALSRDQETALHSLMREAGLDQVTITYDGDTPADARRAAKEHSGVLITNPDMLHTGILPHHASWSRLFSGLRYVVIDEIHTYRGVFGSHLANVIRRLNRIAQFHGSRPSFLFASATIGNPAEHASYMLGREVSIVNQSGAPTGPRRVMIYNPPVVNSELGIRASYIKSAVRLTSDLIRASVTTLVFGQSRNNVEVMLKYLRDRLQRDYIDPDTIVSYRGGYLPQTRRRIETQLREGKIRCVVATNALELGIDIGSLDAVVCAGYPGTISGVWQRFGRGGRRSNESLSILVSSSAPLDQYVARESNYLLGTPIEQARIDPDNIEIFMQHLKCAAFELKFEQGEPYGDLPPDLVDDALQHLVNLKIVHSETGKRNKTVFHWASQVYPANQVSLRNIGEDNFVIVDQAIHKTIGEMDFRAAHTMLHEQAIYQQDGEQFQVENLDFENRKAFVRKVQPDYFTDAMTYTCVSVLEEEEQTELENKVDGARLITCRGEVSIVEKVVGFKKIKFHTHENVGYGDVELPEMQMETSAFWLTVPEQVVHRQRVSRPEVIDALWGLAHALHTVASIGLMTDPRDLGHVLGDRTDPDALPSKERKGEPGFDPTIFIYDRIAGGIGLAPRLYEEREEFLRRTLQLLQGCDCRSGCPACIGPLSAEVSDRPSPFSRKKVAIEILDTFGIRTTH